MQITMLEPCIIAQFVIFIGCQFYAMMEECRLLAMYQELSGSNTHYCFYRQGNVIRYRWKMRGRGNIRANNKMREMLST